MHVDPEFGPLADTDRGHQSAVILVRPVLGEIDDDELQHRVVVVGELPQRIPMSLPTPSPGSDSAAIGGVCPSRSTLASGIPPRWAQDIKAPMGRARSGVGDREVSDGLPDHGRHCPVARESGPRGSAPHMIML